VSVVDTGQIAVVRVWTPTVRATDPTARRQRVWGQVSEETSEQAQFARFVTTRGPALVRLARGLLRDPYQAEDVVQDVLAKVLVQWHRVSAADDMDAYVRRMVVNACTSWFRRAVRRERAHDVTTLPERVDGVDPAAAIADRDRMLGLLRRLPARQRTVLVLRHYEGLPDAEIARLLGIGEVTVRSNAHRGLAALRRMLAEDRGAWSGSRR
jgi:RNA polymerase sigma-70 factor (sigma-E family)